MPGKALVIDANILVRAVLGRRVREIIETYAEQASFFVPEVAYAEAEEHVPALVIKRGGDPDKALRFLRSLRGLVDLIGSEVYSDFESTARERLGDRDPEDWPILAAALAIGCPIWTEDTDFFGCGVPRGQRGFRGWVGRACDRWRKWGNHNERVLQFQGCFTKGTVFHYRHEI